MPSFRFEEYRRRKLPHYQYAGAVMFITVNVWRYPPSHNLLQHAISAKRRSCLILPGIPDIILEEIRRNHGRLYTAHSSILMPDHIHMLIEPCVKDESVIPISRIMHQFKRVTAWRINRNLGFKGQFWQQEWYDRCIRNDREYAHVLSYMRMNPVRAGLVEDPTEWRWFVQFANRRDGSDGG